MKTTPTPGSGSGSTTVTGYRNRIVFSVLARLVRPVSFCPILFVSFIAMGFFGRFGGLLSNRQRWRRRREMPSRTAAARCPSRAAATAELLVCARTGLGRRTTCTRHAMQVGARCRAPLGLAATPHCLHTPRHAGYRAPLRLAAAPRYLRTRRAMQGVAPCQATADRHSLRPQVSAL